MFRSSLLRSYSFPFMAIMVLMLGLCLSVTSVDCHAAVAGHCGAAAHEEDHAIVTGKGQAEQIAEDHNSAGHALHAAAPESCPVAPTGTSQGHQCSHHRASGADTDQPSLYCNCHAKHTDGRTGHSVQEANCLMPRVVSVAPAVPYLPSSSQVEGVLQAVFLDPVEKPPTLS